MSQIPLIYSLIKNIALQGCGQKLIFDLAVVLSDGYLEKKSVKFHDSGKGQPSLIDIYLCSKTKFKKKIN